MLENISKICGVDQIPNFTPRKNREEIPKSLQCTKIDELDSFIPRYDAIDEVLKIFNDVDYSPDRSGVIKNIKLTLVIYP